MTGETNRWCVRQLTMHQVDQLARTMPIEWSFRLPDSDIHPTVRPSVDVIRLDCVEATFDGDRRADWPTNWRTVMLFAGRSTADPVHRSPARRYDVARLMPSSATDRPAYIHEAQNNAVVAPTAGQGRINSCCHLAESRFANTQLFGTLLPHTHTHTQVLSPRQSLLSLWII